MKKNNFINKCLSGETQPSKIDDYVDEWHKNDYQDSLAEYLGFTDEEYSLWVKHPNYLLDVINKESE